MAKTRVTVERMGRKASRRNRKEQEDRVPTVTNNNTGPRPLDHPVNRPVVLALPALPREGNGGNGVLPNGTSDQEVDLEEAHRIIDRFRGGELQFIIDWYEHLQTRMEEIARERTSTEESLPSERRNSPGAGVGAGAGA